MKPTHVVDRSDVNPSIVEMVRAARAAGVDRVSMVRVASPDRTAGVCVLMLSDRSVREVGPFLVETVKTLPQSPQVEIPSLTTGQSLADLMAGMDRLGIQWVWRSFDNWIVCVVVGPAVTEQFAEELTARGCVTNLA